MGRPRACRPLTGGAAAVVDAEGGWGTTLWVCLEQRGGQGGKRMGLEERWWQSMGSTVLDADSWG